MKRVTGKRILTVIIAASMAVSAMAGCGSASETRGGIEWESVGGDSEEATDNSESTETVEETEPEEKYLRVIDATGENNGLNESTMKLLDYMMETEMDYGFSGAQLVVLKDGKMIIDKAWGVTNGYVKPTLDEAGNVIEAAKVDKTSAPVTTDTLFDLASNTKMYATNYAIQKLVYDGLLDIDKKVVDYIPEFKDREGDDQIKGKTEITVRDLMCHQAGFPADPCYHNPENNFIVKYPDLYSHSRSEMLQKIIDTPLKYAPRTDTEYSDVDYMLLGFIVEKITGEGLDTYVKREFYDKMGLTHVTFNPLQNGFTKDDCAATELNGNTRQGRIFYDDVRTDTVWGEVHDEKAYYCMEGVSGHAGLFSNAEDLAKLCQVMLNGGGYGNDTFFSQEIIDEFTAAKNSEDIDWGLGWWRKDNNDTSTRIANFGAESGDGTYGHTGWTGTITIIDPVNNIVVVYLASTKNSPLINKMKNANDFVGNNVSAGALGLAPQLAYEAINNQNDDAMDALLVTMVNERIRSLETHYNKYDEWPHVMDAVEWIEILSKRAKDRPNSVLREGGLNAANLLLEIVNEGCTAEKSINIANEKLPGLIDFFNSYESKDVTPAYGDFNVTQGGTEALGSNTVTVNFPSRLGDTVMSNMVIQNIYGFMGHEGQGKICIKALDGEKAQGLRVFVNGSEVDCDIVKDNPGTGYVIDISKVAKEGMNSLLVCGMNVFNENPGEAVEVVIEK